MEGLLEIVSLEMMTKSVGAGTHSKSWRERASDFRSCNIVPLPLGEKTLLSYSCGIVVL